MGLRERTEGGVGRKSADEEQVGRRTVYRSSFESANHSEGQHQLVRFFPIMEERMKARRASAYEAVE